MASERKHTLLFLRYARAMSPVFIDADVDMARFRGTDVVAGSDRLNYSATSLVIWAAGRVLARHPAANSAASGGRFPKVVTHDSVIAKVAVDKIIDGNRVVVSGLIRDVQNANLQAIQAHLKRFRANAVQDMAEMSGVLKLHRLPFWLAQIAFALRVGPLRTRSQTMGSFAVSSLGHRPINGFQAVGGTTITLNLGQVRDAAVVRDGQIVVSPVLRITMAFDHRVLDGAEAADILSEIKDFLEHEQSADETRSDAAVTVSATHD